MLGQHICQADNRASSARYIPLNHPLFYQRTVARIAPSLDSGQKLIRRLFRDEAKPLETPLWALWADHTYLFASDTSKVVGSRSTCLECFESNFKKEKFQSDKKPSFVTNSCSYTIRLSDISYSELMHTMIEE